MVAAMTNTCRSSPCDPKGTRAIVAPAASNRPSSSHNLASTSTAPRNADHTGKIGDLLCGLMDRDRADRDQNQRRRNRRNRLRPAPRADDGKAEHNGKQQQRNGQFQF